MTDLKSLERALRQAAGNLPQASWLLRQYMADCIHYFFHKLDGTSNIIDMLCWSAFNFGRCHSKENMEDRKVLRNNLIKEIKQEYVIFSVQHALYQLIKEQQSSLFKPENEENWHILKEMLPVLVQELLENFLYRSTCLYLSFMLLVDETEEFPIQTIADHVITALNLVQNQASDSWRVTQLETLMERTPNGSLLVEKIVLEEYKLVKKE